MATSHTRQHWTSLRSRGGDVPKKNHATADKLTLEKLLQEFKHCVGEQIGIDLSEKSKEKLKLIPLTSDEVDAVYSKEHPFLTDEDLPDLDEVWNSMDAEETHDMVFCTDRLQTELENFFVAHLPTLIDQKKLPMIVDHDELTESVHEIQTIIHDYKTMGFITQLKEDISTADLAYMLETAFGDAVDFHRPRRISTNER